MKNISINKELLKKIFFIFIFISALWSLYLFDLLTFALKVERVVIKIITNNSNKDIDKIFRKINIYRVSPKNNITNLIGYSDNRLFYSAEKGYFKKIRIDIPKEYKNFDLIFKIKIGKNDFLETREKLEKEWDKEINEKNISYYSPDYIKFEKSVFPLLKNIINWKGDFNVFVLSYFYIALLIIVIYLFLIKTIYIFLPKELNDKIINYFKSDIKIKELINKNYNNVGGVFYLKKSLSIINRIKLLLLFDRFGVNNYYKLFYSSIFLIIILVALIQRLSIIQIPFSEPDTGGYLGSVINYFDKGIFVQGKRSFPYSLFLLFILSIFNDFSYISIIQHIIGVVSGILLIITWQKIFYFFKTSSINNYIIDFLGLFLVSLYLLSESSVMMEHYILRESIYPFLILLQVCFLISFIGSILNKSLFFNYIFGFLFFINNYFLFIYQPRWGFTLLFNLILYIILFIVLKDYFIKKIIFLFIIPIFFSFLLIFLPDKLLKPKNNIDTFLYGTIFSVHANIIDLELENDINNYDFKKYDKNILIEVRKLIKDVFNEKDRVYKIGFNPNKILYGKTNDYLFKRFIESEYNDFCRYYFFKSILKNPLMYLKKVTSELTQFYNLDKILYERMNYKDKKEIDNILDEDKIKSDSLYIPFLNYLDIKEKLKNSYYDFKEIRVPLITIFLRIFSRTYLIFILLFFIITIYKIIRNEFKNNDFLLTMFILILFFYNFFINLTCAMIHTLEVSRYIADQLVLALLMQFLIIIYILIFIKKFKLNLKSLK